MKKGLTLLLAFIMVFTMQAGQVCAISFTDTEGAVCETAVDVLSALGIVEGKAEGSYEPNSFLTRAEMTTIILRAMNMAEGAVGKDIFADVPATHWGYANIAAAYQMGIINGTSETTFAPDTVVTYEQAVKMVVAALGYTVEAEAMGGYPSGFLAKAAHLDVLKGVTVGGDMTRGNMAILMYNALDKPLLEKASFGEDSLKFDSDEAVTMLSRYLKVEKITGKVVQTPMACADLSPARVLSDEVRVSDGETAMIMKNGNAQAQELLGVRAEILYREDDITDTPVIVTVIPRASSEVLDVPVKDIEMGKTTKDVLVYEKDGKEQKADIAGATLVYNGRARTMDASLLKPDIGTVRLVSETGAAYNLVIVESYINYIVQSVNIDKCKVTFKDGAGSMLIDFSDNNVNTVLTDEKGKPLTLEDVAEGDILSVCRDKEENPSVCRIYRTYKAVEGTLTELSISDKEIAIDGTSYPIAYSMKTEDLKLGKKAAYHLDFTGAIAAVTEIEGNGRVYAWLAAAQYAKGMNPMPQLKMFTQDGEWKVFKTGEYVELNGERVSAKDLLSNGKEKTSMYAFGEAPTLVDNTGKVEPQLVAYEENEEGLLTKIETAYNLTKLDTPDENKIGDTFSMDYYKNDERHARFFNGEAAGSTYGQAEGVYNPPLEYMGGTMFAKVLVRPETKYFIIPDDLTNEKAYSVSSATEVLSWDVNREDITDCLSFYDVNENYVCGAIARRRDIQYGGEEDKKVDVKYPHYEKPAGLILGISKVLGEDGETFTALKVYNSAGQEVVLNVENVEFVQYRNANARMFDQTVEGTVLKGDPAWYMRRENGERYQPTEESEDWIRKINEGTAKEKTYTRKDELFMDVEALVPGDIIHYEADDSGKVSHMSVIYRCEYPGKIEFAYGTSYLSSTGPNCFYRGGNLSLNGTVSKVMDNSILADVILGQISEQDSSVNLGIPSGAGATRILPASGKYVLWDMERREMREITAAETMEGDTVYSWWQTINQRLVVIYR